MKMIDCQRSSFLANNLRSDKKQVVFELGRGRKETLKEIGTFWEGVKSETLNRSGWRKGVRSCASLRRLGAAVSC